MSTPKCSRALMSTHAYGVMVPGTLMSVNKCPWHHGTMLMTALELHEWSLLNGNKLIWVTRPRTGKTLTKCHFFFKSEKLVQTDRSKNRHTFKSYYLILGGKFEPKKILTKKFNLGCAPYARSWVFFSKFSKYSFFVALLLSL